MSAPITLGPADLETDGPALIALNNANEPAVNAITAADLAFLAQHGEIIAARRDGVLCAFLVLLPPGVPYESANYAWFSARYPRFLYVDRVVVSDVARGTGVGRRLYEAALARVDDTGAGVLLAEVNTRPPNPESLAFHARLGFQTLIERENEAAGKRVAMLARAVEAVTAQSESSAAT